MRGQMIFSHKRRCTRRRLQRVKTVRPRNTSTRVITTRPRAARSSSTSTQKMMALLIAAAAPSLVLQHATLPQLRVAPRITRPPTALASYAAEAAGLFGNMQGTAAFIAGGLVPLSSFAGPTPGPDDSTRVKRIKKIHLFIACASLTSELMAVMHATVAKNMLAETVVPATPSLKALLIEGEYALPWTGCNAHFFLGLMGFVSTIAINAWLAFGGSPCGNIGPALTCGASSALLLMLSVVNKAVAKADANAIRAGGSLLGLIGKYLSLLLAEVFVGRKVLVGLAVGFGCAAAFFGAKAVVCSE